MSMCEDEGQERLQSEEEIEIDQDSFSEFEYIIILIKLTLDYEQHIDVRGLVLMKLNGDNIQYKRVGYISFLPMDSDRFKSWIAGWAHETITLI